MVSLQTQALQTKSSRDVIRLEWARDVIRKNSRSENTDLFECDERNIVLAFTLNGRSNEGLFIEATGAKHGEDICLRQKAEHGEQVECERLESCFWSLQMICEKDFERIEDFWCGIFILEQHDE